MPDPGFDSGAGAAAGSRLPIGDERAASATVGVVLLVAVTVVSAGLVGALVSPELSEPPPQAHLSLTAAADGTLAVTHGGGDALDPTTLRLRVSVDGRALAHQPPVPFFAARGFAPGPTGAFNSATAAEWRAGEIASLRVAGTNAPALTPGARVTVRVYAAEAPIAVLRATVTATGA